MKIGEVVDAVGSGRKIQYEGKEYDYVFDVDVQEGVSPLKLPYNVNGKISGSIQQVTPVDINLCQKTRMLRPSVFWNATSYRPVTLTRLFNSLKGIQPVSTWEVVEIVNTSTHIQARVSIHGQVVFINSGDRSL